MPRLGQPLPELLWRLSLFGLLVLTFLDGI